MKHYIHNIHKCIKVESIFAFARERVLLVAAVLFLLSIIIYWTVSGGGGFVYSGYVIDSPIMIKSRSDAVVKSIYVKNGSTVKKGDVLALLSPLVDDPSILTSDYAEALAINDTLKYSVDQDVQGWIGGDTINKLKVDRAVIENKLKKLNEFALAPPESDEFNSGKLPEAMLIRAPSDGVIGSIYPVINKTVFRDEPLISIHDTKARYVEFYLAENDSDCCDLNDRVDIHGRHGNGKTYDGYVSFVSPNISLKPERYGVFSSLMSWGRKITVYISETNELIPGEAVYVSFKGGKLYTSGEADVRPIYVPDSIKEKTTFEPSGAIWADDIDRFIVVSDDTGIRGTESWHGSWLFSMNDRGELDPDILNLQGISQLNDIESITKGDGNTIYLLASQSLSKNDKLPIERQFMIKARRDGFKFIVEAKIPLYQSLSEQSQKRLFGSIGVEEALPDLDIEGMAYYRGDLYLGLKGPLLSGQLASIWRIRDIERIFEDDVLNDNIELWQTVALTSDREHYAGISDMNIDADGTVYLLSTSTRQDGESTESVLWRFDAWQGTTQPLRKFPGLKAEGLSKKTDSNVFYVLFDMQEATPLWATIK